MARTAQTAPRSGNARHWVQRHHTDRQGNPVVLGKCIYENEEFTQPSYEGHFALQIYGTFPLGGVQGYDDLDTYFSSDTEPKRAPQLEIYSYCPLNAQHVLSISDVKLRVESVSMRKCKCNKLLQQLPMRPVPPRLPH